MYKNIFCLTFVKLKSGLENFKGVVRHDLSFPSVIDGLYPGGKVVATGCHVTSRNQGLSSNDQGRHRRETLGTTLITSRLERQDNECASQ